MTTHYFTEDRKQVKTGDRVFNYYDRKPGTIGDDAGDGWFSITHDDGTTALLDGSRICSMQYASGRGWTCLGDNR